MSIHMLLLLISMPKSPSSIQLWVYLLELHGPPPPPLGKYVCCVEDNALQLKDIPSL
jgi:hypothetical protein